MNELIACRNKGLPTIRVAALVVCCALAIAGAEAEPARSLPVASTSANPTTELAQAVSALREITTMQANFTQTDNNGQRLSGVLTLKNPGRIRFQYAPGVPMLIISDGHALIMIDSAVHQLQRWPINNSPLGALLDPKRDVARFGSVQPMLDPQVIGVEVRDRSHPEYGTMTLVFARRPAAPGGLELTGWLAVDAQNSRTVIRLANHRYGMPVADELFRYLDPRARPHK